MKDAARLLCYFAVTVLFGALAAPILYWAAQWLAANGVFTGLARTDFERFFHRSLLLGALICLWPLLRWLRIESPRDLCLVPNPRWRRDGVIGFLISALPVAACGILFLAVGTHSIRAHVAWTAVVGLLPTVVIVPLIEEAFFRGLMLGVLLRSTRAWTAALLTAAIYSIIHFLKAPDQTTEIVGWTSGFTSLVHSFDQFSEPRLLLAAFTTLFVIGLILSQARIWTESLWLPIGLHAGWIFSSRVFNKIARSEFVALPWVGKNLLVGIVPLGVCLLSAVLLKEWLRYAGPREK